MPAVRESVRGGEDPRALMKMLFARCRDEAAGGGIARGREEGVPLRFLCVQFVSRLFLLAIGYSKGLRHEGHDLGLWHLSQTGHRICQT